MKNNANVKQFMRYFIAAAIGYCVDFGSLILFHEVFKFHYLTSASIGFTLGLIVIYIISSRFVFGESKIKSKSAEFILFAIIGVVGLLLLNVLMWILTGLFGFYYLFSKIIATVAVYLWNFFARRSLYRN